MTNTIKIIKKLYDKLTEWSMTLVTGIIGLCGGFLAFFVSFGVLVAYIGAAIQHARFIEVLEGMGISILCFWIGKMMLDLSTYYFSNHKNQFSPNDDIGSTCL